MTKSSGLGLFWGLVILQVIALAGDWLFALHYPWFIVMLPTLVWLACITAICILLVILLGYLTYLSIKDEQALRAPNSPS